MEVHRNMYCELELEKQIHWSTDQDMVSYDDLCISLDIEPREFNAIKKHLASRDLKVITAPPSVTNRPHLSDWGAFSHIIEVANFLKSKKRELTPGQQGLLDRFKNDPRCQGGIIYNDKRKWTKV